MPTVSLPTASAKPSRFHLWSAADFDTLPAHAVPRPAAPPKAKRRWHGSRGQLRKIADALFRDGHTGKPQLRGRAAFLAYATTGRGEGQP